MPVNGATNYIVASFSPLKAWPLLSVFLFIAVIFVWGWSSAITDPEEFFDFGSSRTYFLAVGTLLFVWYLLPRLRLLLRQLLSVESAAMWVDGGYLIYLDRKFFSIPCHEIASISPDVFGTFNQAGINIRSRDGREKILPTGTLAEPTEVILDRLRLFCATGVISDHSLKDGLP